MLQYSFSAILMRIIRKPVQRRETGEKCGFFAARWPSHKVKQNHCGIVIVNNKLEVISRSRPIDDQ